MSEHNESIVESFFKTFSGKPASLKEKEEFEERIRTYIADQKWVRRPLALSPALCSQYGWKCINSNLLECGTCGAKLCAPEPKIEMFDVYKACMEKIFKDLKTSHKTHCPWPLTPSPDSFVKMALMPKEEALNLFLSNIKSSLDTNLMFPQIKNNISSKLELSEEQIASLCKLAELDSDDTKKFGTSAVILAVTGWTLEIKKIALSKIFITCHNCQRSIQVEAFNVIDISSCEETTTETNGSATKLQNENNDSSQKFSPFKSKRFKKDDFDPLEEHRPWCLWINKNKQKCDFELSQKTEVTDSPQDLIVGWQIFLKSLLRNISEPKKDDPSKEQLRSVRSLLESWTDS